MEELNLGCVWFMGKESWGWEINCFPMFGKFGMGKRCLAHGKIGGKVNPSFLLGFHFPFPWERVQLGN
ncbi:hypothetical protein Pyn_13818 [Prunus yedoensis var. nudiflora]|uniref:Uncharacterized protein n=1 Tax=Prunus yedoensis var. nudiflora TaxID=2094558 RepID=A0A314UPP4_PRUYE|nr:hypothetical protein Pyn_13818 [Prunus yedoensis var. nudiflora]